MTTEEAKARLLAVSQQSIPMDFVTSNPLRAVALSLVAGIVVGKSAPLLHWLTRHGFSLLAPLLLPRVPVRPAQTSSPTLERIRARTCRRNMK